jgi:pyridoxal phosphate enzyme (YggS family)
MTFKYSKIFYITTNTILNMNLENNYYEIKKNLSSDITLIAVSKTKPLPMIEKLYLCGQLEFGENYLQEAIEKINYFKSKNNMKFDKIKWHFIGHIQSNKIKKIVKYFDMIQSVSSSKHLELINLESKKHNKIMPVLIEINIGDEIQKSGVRTDELNDLLDNIKNMTNIELKGFMCIPPNNVDILKTRNYFLEMKSIFDKYKMKYNLTILSMGMSLDYKLAIDCGSNMVRVGSKIFGNRI